MLIDPGHGGADPGAVSNGICEKNITLAYATNLGEAAAKSGRTVRYTRTTDATLDLNARSKMVKPGEILISCHTNSVGTPAAKGCSVWYHKDNAESYKLAVHVMQHILATQMFSQYNTGVLCDIPRYHTGFAMLREAAEIGARAAILIEPGFISNPKDRAVLTNPAKRLVLAEAINNGLHDYIEAAKNA